MTLGDYIDLVCTKMHRTDGASQENARKYLRSRYRMIYEAYAWRDVTSIGGVSLAATQVVILPYIVDRIMGCRWGDNVTLRNDSLWTILNIDPSRFDLVGDPISYTTISPSAVRVSPAGQKLTIQTASSSPNFTVSIYGSYQSDEVSEVISITGISAIDSVNNYDEIYSLSKSDESHDVTVRRKDNSAQLLYLRANEKERKHQRLHFHSTPTNTTTALVLFKRSFKPLVNDTDAPEIAGIENALLAFGIADMLEDQKHYGKAQAKMQEALAMVKTMADLERHQSENVIRIIPIVSDNEEMFVSSDKSWFTGD